MHAAPRLLALAVLAPALLAACSDDSSPAPTAGGSSTTLTATPSLGKVFNAGIEVRCLPTNTVMGSGDTGATGSVAVPLTGSCAGPVMVELLPNGGSSYFDEKLGTTANVVSGSLRTLLPSLSGSNVNVAITPLTEIATRQALLAAGGTESAITALQVNTANSAVAPLVFGTRAASLNILQPPTLWDSSITNGALADTNAGRYALLLAGLARMGTGATPALSVANALAADLTDGTLSNTTAVGATWTSADFATQRDAALTDVANYASPALQTALAINTGVGGGDLLNILAQGSIDLIPVTATHTALMAKSVSSTNGGDYNRAVNFQSVESEHHIGCTIALNAAGTLTVTLNGTSIGTKSTSVSLVGKSLGDSGTLMLTPEGSSTAQSVHGYSIWLESPGDVNKAIVWADAAFYQGPVSATIWLNAVPSAREEFSCYVR